MLPETTPSLEFLSERGPKQQPNLLFGCLRYVCGATPDSRKDFRQWRNVNREQIRQIMLNDAHRRTNPPGVRHCFSYLALLPQSLALLEIGASAGLCLLPDLPSFFSGIAMWVTAPVRVAPRE